MLLLKRVTAQGVLRTNVSVKFQQSVKFMHYVQNTFSRDLRFKVFTEKNSSLAKLISCKYSSTIKDDVQEEISESKAVDAENDEMTEKIFQEISNGDEEILKKLHMAKFEYEVMKQSGHEVPQFLSKKHWEELMFQKSVFMRKKFLTFLFKREKKRENDLKKKQARKEEYLRKKQERDSMDETSYNLSSQSLLLRVYSKTLTLNLNMKNLVCEEFAQKIIFDCSYQDYMSELNTKFCAAQLFLCMYTHLTHCYPNLISLYNFQKTDRLYEVLPKYLFSASTENFPWEMHEGSYLDHYPKENLVYLTPHCLEPLEQLNPEDTYIIGAFVDKGVGVKASLAKAKKNKLRMARLPIDEYLHWKKGTKSLPLNIVLKTILDMRYYNNWSVAFKNLPTRHYKDCCENFGGDIFV